MGKNDRRQPNRSNIWRASHRAAGPVGVCLRHVVLLLPHVSIRILEPEEIEEAS